MTDDNERVVRVTDERTIPEITQAIEDAGGQVLHQLGRVLIVYAPAETRSRLTNLPAGTRLATAQETLGIHLKRDSKSFQPLRLRRVGVAGIVATHRYETIQLQTGLETRD